MSLSCPETVFLRHLTGRRGDKLLVKSNEVVIAALWESSFPVGTLVEDYRAGEKTTTGTVVFHAGRIKLPGKKVPDMTHALLEPLTGNPGEGLRKIGSEALKRFDVSRVHIHHRMGKVLPGDDILLVIVSSKVRDPAFKACSWVVDAIKREEVIRLVEKS